MNCEFAEKVSALIDGELSSDEARMVERHLSECASCQEMRADFYSIGREIESYPLHAPSSQRPYRKPIRPVGFGLWKPAFITIATILLVVFGVMLWLHFQNQRQAEPGFITQNNSGSSSSKPPAAPSPVSSPEPASSPKSTTKEDEVPETPPKFRLREAITGVHPRRVKSVPKPEPTELADNLSDKIEPNNAEGSSPTDTSTITSADTESLTAQHVEQSELLLRTFRNLRTTNATDAELLHERRRAQQLFYRNVMLLREADSSGNVQVATLLQSLEPILLDIANLPNDAADSDVVAIKDRVERQNLVALLQINTKAPVRNK